MYNKKKDEITWVQKKKDQEAFIKYTYEYKYKIKIIQSKTKKCNIMHYNSRFGKKIIKICARTDIEGGLEETNLLVYSDFVLFFPTITKLDGIKYE